MKNDLSKLPSQPIILEIGKIKLFLSKIRLGL